MRSTARPLGAAALALLASGCMALTWWGYDDPAPADLAVVAPDYPYCMRVGLQNLDARQAAAIREAARDVCAIVVSPRFRSALIGRNWLASCDREPDGSDDVVTGLELSLRFDALPPFSVQPRKPVAAVAQSYADYGTGWGSDPDNRIAIDPARIEGWYDDDRMARSAFINTLAHEITHLGVAAVASRRDLRFRVPDPAALRRVRLTVHAPRAELAGIARWETFEMPVR